MCFVLVKKRQYALVTFLIMDFCIVPIPAAVLLNRQKKSLMAFFSWDAATAKQNTYIQQGIQQKYNEFKNISKIQMIAFYMMLQQMQS